MFSSFFNSGSKIKFIPDGLTPEEAVLHHLHGADSSTSTGLGDSEEFDKKGFAYLIGFILLCVVAYFYWGPTVRAYFNKNNDGVSVQAQAQNATPKAQTDKQTATPTQTNTATPTVTTSLTITATKTTTTTIIIIDDSNHINDINKIIASTGITNSFSITESKQLIQNFGYDVINNVPGYAWKIIPQFGLTNTMPITEILSLAQSGVLSQFVSLMDQTPIFISPITPTVTPSPTYTPTPTTDYIVISHETTPIDDMYPYISGWILESDQTTARPAKIELCHPTKCMSYPRPNNTDIATGYYEFLAEPGDFYLKIGQLTYNIKVISTTNHHINLKYTTDNKLESPAKSIPWGNKANKATPKPTANPTPTPTATPTPTPTPIKIYLAQIIKQSTATPAPKIEEETTQIIPEQTINLIKINNYYLPLIIRNNQ